MVATTLPGPWRAHATTDDLRRDFIEADFDDSGWLDFEVPGHWAGHPELAARPSVLLRTTFTLPADISAGDSRHWLMLDGIWQSGDAWLDGAYLGPTSRWFTIHEFEITEQIHGTDEHVLAIEVMSPRQDPDEPTRTLNGILDDPDVVGHENLGGMLAPVRIVSTGPVRLSKNRVICTAATATEATVHLRSHLQSEDLRDVTIVTTLRPPGGGVPITTRKDHHVASGATVLEWEVTIPEPELWWPWSLGDQPIYRINVAVEVDGSISSMWDRTVGLREVRMKNWILSVNGHRLFAKGVDVWPTKALLGLATAEQVADDVALAKDLGLDLLRVESHVARPEFYEAADRLGMLVWQDLPLRGEVKRSVQAHAIDAAHRLVDRLGAHPSIVVWCGHYDPTGTTTGRRPSSTLPTRRSLFGVAKQQLPTWTKSVLDRLVARAFSRADGSRPVVAGSGTWPSAPRFDGTDTHLRFGWNSGSGRDLESFARRMPRMVRWVSSLGGQSLPHHADVRVLDWPADLGLLSDRYGLDESGFREYLPTAAFSEIGAWIDASQAYQATLLRRQIETLRRLKYSPTGGFTFAALADARPAISYAIFDHDRKPKQAVAAVRAACKPVIVVSDRLPTELHAGEAVLLDVHVVNDQPGPIDRLETVAELSWQNGGSHCWAWRGDVDADSVARVGSINWIVPDEPGHVSLHLYLRHAGIEIADNHYHGEIRSR